MKIHNNSVVMTKYKTEKYTREQIRKIVQKFSNNLKEKDFNSKIEVYLSYSKNIRLINLQMLAQK
jgi:ssRNA-specific RNase YbeY (16S rRNA maturation enzyme)